MYVDVWCDPDKRSRAGLCLTTAPFILWSTDKSSKNVTSQLSVDHLLII